MGTGYWRAHLIEASQTTLDGNVAAYQGHVPVGAVWRWHGRAFTLREPVSQDEPVPMQLAVGAERASRSLRRIFGRTEFGLSFDKTDAQAPSGPVIEVTDGRRSYRASVVRRVIERGQPVLANLLMFDGDMPPADADLKLIAAKGFDGLPDAPRQAAPRGSSAGVYAAAMVLTPDGPKRADALREGDLVLDRDRGPVPIVSARARRMTGARFFAMPHLRPLILRVPFRGLAPLANAHPVPPHQTVVLRHRLLRPPFDLREVLVEARDLADAGLAAPALSLAHADFIELELPQHGILTIDGALMGSRLPGGCRPGADPGPGADAALPARRFLSRQEAAIAIGRIAGPAPGPH